MNAVKEHGGLTQVELVTLTGLSSATVSSIVKELTSAGVVDVTPTSHSGRRAVRVTLSRRVGLVGGVHVGQRHLHVALADYTGEVVAEQRMPLPRDHRADSGLDNAALLLVDLLESVDSSPAELGGVGVAVPAPVDPETGVISVPGLMSPWDGISIPRVLSTRLRTPVHVDNDANLGALGERQLGAARRVDDVVYVRASHTVGAGVVVSGAVVHGLGGTAGELGHLRMDENGRICRCGARGCLDTVVGATALLDLLRDSHGTLTLRDLVARALEGDAGCRRVVSDAGRHIGTAVAGLCAVTAPRLIVVGGELAETGDVLLDPIRAAVEQHLPNSGTPVPVVPAALGLRAEVLGAVALALSRAEIRTAAPPAPTVARDRDPGRDRDRVVAPAP